MNVEVIQTRMIDGQRWELRRFADDTGETYQVFGSGLRYGVADRKRRHCRNYTTRKAAEVAWEKI